MFLLRWSILWTTNTHPVVSPTFTFKTRLTSTTADAAEQLTSVTTCVCVLCSPVSIYIETSFLLEIVFRWMNKRTEKSCFEIVQWKQEVLTRRPWRVDVGWIWKGSHEMGSTDIWNKLRDWFVMQPITWHFMAWLEGGGRLQHLQSWM